MFPNPVIFSYLPSATLHMVTSSRSISSLGFHDVIHFDLSPTFWLLPFNHQPLEYHKDQPHHLLHLCCQDDPIQAVGLNDLHDFDSDRESDRWVDRKMGIVSSPTFPLIPRLLLPPIHNTLPPRCRKGIWNLKQTWIPHPRFIPLPGSWVSVNVTSIHPVLKPWTWKSPSLLSPPLHSVQTPSAKVTLSLVSVLHILWEHNHLTPYSHTYPPNPTLSILYREARWSF